MSSLALYAQSTEVVRDFLVCKGSLKSLCYRDYIVHKKATYALACQTLKYRFVLQKLLRAVEMPGFNKEDAEQKDGGAAAAAAAVQETEEGAAATAAKTPTSSTSSNSRKRKRKEQFKQQLKLQRSKEQVHEVVAFADDDTDTDTDAAWTSGTITVAIEVSMAKAAGVASSSSSSSRQDEENNTKKSKRKKIKCSFAKECALVIAYELLFGSLKLPRFRKNNNNNNNGNKKAFRDEVGIVSAVRAFQSASTSYKPKLQVCLYTYTTI